jgi:hypothetical protein
MDAKAGAFAYAQSAKAGAFAYTATYSLKLKDEYFATLSGLTRMQSMDCFSS